MAKYKEYLNSIGMPIDYCATEINCELCGGASYVPLRETARINETSRALLPVVICKSCGFIYQLPRFSADFYKEYYLKKYRNIISGTNVPSAGFLDDQIERGRYLYESLTSYFSKTGNLLDVGSSAGGLMVPFKENGWHVLGVDPDESYVKHGQEIYNIEIYCLSAEEMKLKEKNYDLIIINGSLEHVFDPNAVLSLCSKSAKSGSLLLLEGRGLAQARQLKTFGHNHRRYLTINTAEIFMRKHGWEPILSTNEELCGPTRPESIYVLGKYTGKKNNTLDIPINKDDIKSLIEKTITMLDKAGVH
ncbi:class I SAM-dependent methyltransferase [Pseudomonas indica]|uniref:class I SAM-dependent methyltransferase n=1 Tax=Pseudomonas indica TaxID=137658 RepID=UPI0023F9B351|nr:class I SAM-dependent methyltransferase [Pseudomonas indica]MBU3056542.1 class I SAM-dependent methyltransferase [Pseudomonas indica]